MHSPMQHAVNKEYRRDMERQAQRERMKAAVKAQQPKRVFQMFAVWQQVVALWERLQAHREASIRLQAEA